MTPTIQKLSCRNPSSRHGQKKWRTFLKKKCSKHGYQLGEIAKVLKRTNQIHQQGKRVSQASGDSPRSLYPQLRRRGILEILTALVFTTVTRFQMFTFGLPFFFFFFGNKYELESVTSIGKRERIN